MLSPEDNELLTRVGPGTPMGNLLRCFWQPFALATELPGPLHVRVLGQDLVISQDASVLVGPNDGAYPTIERGGVLWAYLGKQEHMPSLPELEWTRVPDNQRYVSKRIQFCNYLQN